MAGKASVFASVPLWAALDKLSKNALLDLVVDRARAELGETATDDSILETIQGWIGPVQRQRGDKPINLLAAHDHFIRQSNAARERMIQDGWDPAKLPPPVYLPE
jgi:hypothetical protein